MPIDRKASPADLNVQQHLADRASVVLARRDMGEYANRMVHGYTETRHTRALVGGLNALAVGDIRKLAIFMPPRHGKPVTIEAMVLCGDGSYKRLGDISIGDSVITHLGRARTVEAVFEQPGQRGVRIVTQSGRATEAAVDHPFLTPSGWVLAGDLAVGMVLGNVAAPAVSGVDAYPIEAYRLAGYFVGDGCCKQHRATIQASITSVDPGVIADIETCAAALGFGMYRKGITTNLSGGVREWLRETGLIGCGAHDKRVPNWIFTASPRAIGEFLGAYFDCDGSIAVRGGVGRKDVAVEVYSVSRGLLVDVQRLFLRLGIQTRLRVKMGQYKGQPHTSYRLAITDMDGVARFTEFVPLRSTKAERRGSYVRTRFAQPVLADPIVEISQIESLDCRCLTVAEDHTFTSDDFIVHNTMHASELFPSFYLGRKPDAQIILASYTIDRARQSSRKARGHFFEATWPFESVELDRKAASVDQWHTLQGGLVKAAGVAGSMTGFGAHLLVIDDPIKDRAEANSPTRRQAIWEWYQEVARTRLMSGARELLMLTRWHDDDLAGRVLNSGAAKDWTVLLLPAWAICPVCQREECDLPENDRTSPQFMPEAHVNHGARDSIGRLPGEVLWPEAEGGPPLPRVELGEISSIGREALYQQRPVPEQGALFKRAWLARRWTNEAALPRFKRAILAIDGAWKEGISNDRSALALWATDDVDYYLIKAWAGRVEYPDLKTKVKDFWTSCIGIAPQLVAGIEDAASGIPLIQEFRRSTMIPIIGVKVDASKYTRAEAATPPFEGQKVVLPEAADWLDEWVEEHVRFPGATHDDWVDTTSIAIARLASGGSTWSFARASNFNR